MRRKKEDREHCPLASIFSLFIPSHYSKKKGVETGRIVCGGDYVRKERMRRKKKVRNYVPLPPSSPLTSSHYSIHEGGERKGD